MLSRSVPRRCPALPQRGPAHRRPPPSARSLARRIHAAAADLTLAGQAVTGRRGTPEQALIRTAGRWRFHLHVPPRCPSVRHGRTPARLRARTHPPERRDARSHPLTRARCVTALARGRPWPGGTAAPMGNGRDCGGARRAHQTPLNPPDRRCAELLALRQWAPTHRRIGHAPGSGIEIWGLHCSTSYACLMVSAGPPIRRYCVRL